ncbi:MAG: metal ABC transporter ATP-binding protein [Pseudomonadales bacterium]
MSIAQASLDPRSAAISVRDVSVVYNNGHRAIEHISFDISRGTVAALVGINGSGKSTLFKAIMGFVPCFSGQVNIAGMSVKQALKHNRIAYVPQSEDIDWDFPVLVEEVVMMGRFAHMGWLRIPRAADYLAVDEALAQVSMLDFKGRQIGELSGGQRKRVFLARALAQCSDLILLDEPFTGVDVSSEDHIIELLQQLAAAGKTVLVSTHNLGSVPRFCDHTVLINKRLLASGKTADVFNTANLERTFGGVLRRFVLSGDSLHKDADARELTVLCDDESPVVLYGERGSETFAHKSTEEGRR